MGGKFFAETVADLPPKAREAAIVQEILRGNIPDFLRTFVTIKVGDGVAYEVMPDYLAIGTDADFVRMPMMPQSAAIIATAFGCTLPTRKMVNDIYAQAAIKLEPGNADYRVSLALLFRDLGFSVRAKGEAERAVAADPNNQKARDLLRELKGV